MSQKTRTSASSAIFSFFIVSWIADWNRSSAAPSSLCDPSWGSFIALIPFIPLTNICSHAFLNSASRLCSSSEVNVLSAPSLSSFTVSAAISRMRAAMPSASSRAKSFPISRSFIFIVGPVAVLGGTAVLGGAGACDGPALGLVVLKSVMRSRHYGSL